MVICAKFKSNEPMHNIFCKTTCAPSEYLDQTVDSRNVISDFTGHFVGSQGSKADQADSED